MLINLGSETRPAAGWVTGERLLEDAGPFEAALATWRSLHGDADPLPATSALMKAYAATLAYPAVEEFVVTGEVPDVRLSRIAVRFESDWPVDIAQIGRPAWFWRRSGPAGLWKTLVGQHLDDVATWLATRFDVPASVLRSAIVDQVAAAFRAAAEDNGEGVLEAAVACFSRASRPYSGEASLHLVRDADVASIDLRRRVCCLQCRLDELGFCDDCPRRRLREELLRMETSL